MNEKKSLILIVEDEEQVLNTNCRMLRRRGYDVRTAHPFSLIYSNSFALFSSNFHNIVKYLSFCLWKYSLKP